MYTLVHMYLIILINYTEYTPYNSIYLLDLHIMIRVEFCFTFIQLNLLYS